MQGGGSKRALKNRAKLCGWGAIFKLAKRLLFDYQPASMPGVVHIPVEPQVGRNAIRIELDASELGETLRLLTLAVKAFEDQSGAPVTAEVGSSQIIMLVVLRSRELCTKIAEGCSVASLLTSI